MNYTVIADTSGLFSLVSVTDRNHANAVTAGERLFTTKGTVILPSDVFTETINILGKKADHAAALKTARIFLSEPAFLIVDSDAQLREQTVEKFQTQAEGVSFTDCLVMAYADHFQTTQIFGFDEIFRKNGYTALTPA